MDKASVIRKTIYTLLTIAVLLCLIQLSQRFIRFSEGALLFYFITGKLLFVFSILGIVVLLLYWNKPKPKKELIIVIIALFIPELTSLLVAMLPKPVSNVTSFASLFAPPPNYYIDYMVFGFWTAVMIAMLIVLLVKGGKGERLILVPYFFYFLLAILDKGEYGMPWILEIVQICILIAVYISAIKYTRRKAKDYINEQTQEGAA